MSQTPSQEDHDRVDRQCEKLLDAYRLLWEILDKPRHRKLRRTVTSLGKHYAALQKRIATMDRIDLLIAEEDIDEALQGLENVVNKWAERLKGLDNTLAAQQPTDM